MEIYQIIFDQLIKKYEELKVTLLNVIQQLNTEQLNWRFNNESNSIANLIIHIAGNINQRIGSGILALPDTRDRNEEFDQNLYVSKDQIVVIVENSFTLLIQTTKNMNKEDLLKTIQVRDKSRFTYEVLQQCANHYSEHLGQIIYIAKICLGSHYQTTSIYGSNQKI